MSEKEFWEVTPRFFRARLKAHRRQQQFQLECARFQSFFVLKTVDSKGRIRRMGDVIRFDWDDEGRKQPQFEPMSAEDLEKFSREADIIFERMMAEKNNTVNGKHS